LSGLGHDIVSFSSQVSRISTSIDGQMGVIETTEANQKFERFQSLSFTEQQTLFLDNPSCYKSSRPGGGELENAHILVLPGSLGD